LLHETNDANNILELNDYRVGFRTERGLAKAVDGVSLSLKRGSTLAIVGESGSGKTVLNRGIMGLLGANIIEAQYSISKKEFRAKMSIALKEAAESRYWINLLKDEEYLSEKQANSLINDLSEIIKILVKVVKNAN
jgi:ABC-type dipeptide/oligopeptide/nickel transport system ATPase component